MVSGNNWSYKTCKAPVKSSQPTVSEHWRENKFFTSAQTIFLPVANHTSIIDDSSTTNSHFLELFRGFPGQGPIPRTFQVWTFLVLNSRMLQDFLESGETMLWQWQREEERELDHTWDQFPVADQSWRQSNIGILSCWLQLTSHHCEDAFP